MIKHGPVDVVELAFGEPRFDGSILMELERQVATGTIRVLDAMVLFKDGDGECWRLDLEDLPPEEAAALGFIETGTRGLFDSDDADTLWEGMVPGTKSQFAMLTGKSASCILQMMDGSTTFEEITQRTYTRFPLQFSSFEGTLEHMQEVFDLYGRRVLDKPGTNVQVSKDSRRDSLKMKLEEV